MGGSTTHWEQQSVFHLSGPGRDLVDIRSDIDFDVTHCPGYAAGDDCLDERIGPDIVAVAERGVEDARGACSVERIGKTRTLYAIH